MVRAYYPAITIRYSPLDRAESGSATRWDDAGSIQGDRITYRYLQTLTPYRYVHDKSFFFFLFCLLFVTLFSST